MTTATRSTYARFGTLLGAVVSITRTEPARSNEPVTFTWSCNGCQARNSEFTEKTQAAKARQAANDHAGTCRALPPR